MGMVCVSFIPSSTDTGVHRTAHVFALLCVRMCVGGLMNYDVRKSGCTEG